MYIYVEEKVKCSKCGGTNVEYVRRGLVSFIRCLGCNHEGGHDGGDSTGVAERSTGGTVYTNIYPAELVF